MKEIESLRTDNPKAYWNKLRGLNKINKKRESWDTAIDKDGTDVAGEEIKIIWNTAYEELGKEDLENEEFDKSFIREVEEEIQEMEENSKSYSTIKNTHFSYSHHFHQIQM